MIERDALTNFFNPESIAIVGASRNKKKVGHGLLKNIIKGHPKIKDKNQGTFKGRIFPVNPNADSILGMKCYPSLLEIKEKIDLAIVILKPKVVEKTIRDCIEKKVNGVMIISAGFAESDKKGKEIQDKITRMLKEENIPLLGPNCLGFINCHNSINASFAPSMPPKGGLTLLSQSGALIDSVIDVSIEREYGFSHLVSMGNSADIDVADLIDFFGNEKNTKAIAIYLESIKDGKKFMRIAKRVSKSKPMIILKSGRFEKSKEAVSSHTGNVAGSYDIYKAAFKQAGAIVADTLEDLLNISFSCVNLPRCDKKSKGGIAIVTNGGGMGVLCADYCEELRIPMAKFKEKTLRDIDKTGVMNSSYSRRNPLDIIGDALPERYHAVLEKLLSEDYINGAIVLQTLQIMTQPMENAQRIVSVQKKYKKPVVCCFFPGEKTKKVHKYLLDNGIPDFDDPKKAAIVMDALMKRKD